MEALLTIVGPAGNTINYLFVHQVVHLA